MTWFLKLLLILRKLLNLVQFIMFFDLNVEHQCIYLSSWMKEMVKKVGLGVKFGAWDYRLL